jgi:hypothetical protein
MTDPTVLASLAGAAGVVLSGLISFLAVRYTQRSAQRATAASERLERVKVDAEAYESAKATWNEHVAVLRGQVAELRVRVVELEADQARCDQRVLDLTRYSRSLMRLLTENDIAHPSPPGVQR